MKIFLSIFSLLCCLSFAQAQNTGSDLNAINISPPQFTCIPMAKGKEFKVYRNGSNSRFPF